MGLVILTGHHSNDFKEAGQLISNICGLPSINLHIQPDEYAVETLGEDQVNQLHSRFIEFLPNPKQVKKLTAESPTFKVRYQISVIASQLAKYTSENEEVPHWLILGSPMEAFFHLISGGPVGVPLELYKLAAEFFSLSNDGVVATLLMPRIPLNHTVYTDFPTWVHTTLLEDFYMTSRARLTGRLICVDVDNINNTIKALKPCLK